MRDVHQATLLSGLLLLFAGCDSSKGGDGDGGGGGDGGGKPARPFGEVTQTTAEYITPDAACETHDVACLLPCPADDLYVAINPTDYAGSEACGACMEVTGPLGTVTVSVIENCAGACVDGEIELSEAAFAQIADVSEGHAEVSWRLVSCSLSGPVAFHFEPESSEWWASIQVRNHVMPVRSVAVQTGDGGWLELTRRAHNYFDSNEAGPGPYTLRVRSIDDQELIEPGIPLSPGALVQGQGQFE
jgi:expansin (peptidoglycan-binding protein)